MIANFGDIKNDVIRKLGISTTAAFYTDTILNEWIQQGVRWGTSYKKWPFTEGRISTTYAATEEWSFEGIKADSIRLLQVGGKRFQKLNFEDYQIFKEEEPDGEDRVYSDFGRLVFINPNAGVSGTLVAWGQYAPVNIDVTDLTAQTVFSDGDEEGNEAIVEEVLSYANTREKKENEVNFHHTRATQILDNLWNRIKDEQFQYQTHRSRGGMFKRINVLGGGVDDELIRRDQFPLG
ncbi:MAG: hypothetical protein UT51_C0009G0005 [Candidatus Nomurabacteria bacterium GW2011_GWC2_39_41]|uniref:Uncharacterized protein n=1 Tax=Candidatus Nomurabacteria bacterium GW2011_GWC2_39_41 TaxID=1618754 RepID=A0A837I0L8_9BACT|nr:MAG: hypothetical protein UT51_C0009G0005 [Candidatus Nomurabacteria bacterium GW2011_GWC2_39_41]KKR39252.1 MAG: hypothetical protein UT74_C0015G0003 [Parcubacteria group bacterium GW2011_GWC1_40_11]